MEVLSSLLPIDDLDPEAILSIGLLLGIGWGYVCGFMIRVFLMKEEYNDGKRTNDEG